MINRIVPCFAAALWLSAALPVSAASTVAAGQGISGPELVTIVQDMGYRAKLEKDGEGDPSVSTTMSGLNVQIYFYDCQDRRCGSLQLSVGLDMTDGSSLEAMNRFSKNYRYAHVFLDEEKDPFMQYDFEVLHTNHAEHVKSQMELFENLLEDFTRISGFNGDTAPETGDDAAADAAQASANAATAAAAAAAAAGAGAGAGAEDQDAAQTSKPVTGKLDL